jgi:site-specific DNA-methyltransferase (adenine-specific)
MAEERIEPPFNSLPTPYYEADGITIYHGDCRDILPALPPVNLVLTDPPYNEVNRTAHGTRWRLDHGLSDSADVDIPWLARQLALTTTGSMYVWCSAEQLSPLRTELITFGMSTRVGVWHKTNPAPMNADVIWLSAIELCVYAKHSGGTFTEHCASPVWTGPLHHRGAGIPNDHPTPKPEWLFKRLILASTNHRDVVLDPFMGSGTTLRAAKDLNRRAIGIEIDERWCELAATRLAQGVLDLA